MSRAKAIAEKCKDCIYDPKSPGTVREQITLCTSEKSCALWPYRPVTIALTRGSKKIKLPNLGSDVLENDHNDNDNDE